MIHSNRFSVDRIMRGLASVAASVVVLCAMSAPASAQAVPRQFIDQAVLERLRPREVPALAEGEVRILEALIIEVKGRAQWRADEEGPWQPAQVDDILKPGASLRTGTDSRITLRVGHNATIFVADRTRISVPEIAQEGATLRTRAVLRDGDADIKVERVGLTNDFEVITPTTTLAVKGTGFRIIAGALEGVQVRGSRANLIAAIELSYVFRKMRVHLSGGAKSSEAVPDPVLNAMHDTLGPPAVWGAAVDAVGSLEGGFARDIGFEGERQLQLASDLDDRFNDLLDSFPPPNGNGNGNGNGHGNNSDFFEFFGGFGDSFIIAEFLCMIAPDLFPIFQQELRNEGLLRPEQFNAMVENFNQICGSLEQFNDPLFELLSEVIRYCEALGSTENTNRCLDAFGHSFEILFDD